MCSSAPVPLARAVHIISSIVQSLKISQHQASVPSPIQLPVILPLSDLFHLIGSWVACIDCL
ncbi:hypothetical protein BGX38DRAFT_1159866 [Terfezia claveryi]|nr:hypothetical protein BGX38DRAFT_1159866 [Terfezia claveryi]